MPVLYALYREKYTLLIEIDLDSYPPASFVKAESNELEGQDLRVGGLARGSWCSRFDSYVVGAKTGEFLRYVWGGGRSAECSNREFSAEERTFTLRIVDEADNFLGEEILAFTIVKNGSFIEYDSL